MKSLDSQELKELLLKGWMTHDGVWFWLCAQEYGIEAANRLNKAAIKIIAPLEVRRMTRALDIKGEGFDTFDELRQTLDDLRSVRMGDFMGFKSDWVSESALRWEMKECFAYEGIKRMGMSEEYECGALYFLMCLVDSLGVEYTIDPPIEGCLMRDSGKCEGVMKFTI